MLQREGEKQQELEWTNDYDKICFNNSYFAWGYKIWL